MSARIQHAITAIWVSDYAQPFLQPSPEALQEHWHRHRFEYLDIPPDLPALLPARTNL
jgi:hypothetical protein